MRDSFIDLLVRLSLNGLNLRALVSQVAPLAWAQVPMNATPEEAVRVIVGLAFESGWAAKLATALAVGVPTSSEAAMLAKALTVSVPTTAQDPFDEVLLPSKRLFVDRKELRTRLRDLCAPDGTTLLLLDGEPKTGKSHTFYFTSYVVPKHGYQSHLFEVKKYPAPDQLTEAILERLGVAMSVKRKGKESAERWAEKLASQIKDALEQRSVRRFFVFDDFPPSPMPEGTESLVLRLAKYADEELRDSLRLVLIQFPGLVPKALDDVAERETVQMFTTTDALEAILRVAEARGRDVTPRAIQTELSALNANGPVAMETLAQFVRDMIGRLS